MDNIVANLAMMVQAIPTKQQAPGLAVHGSPEDVVLSLMRSVTDAFTQAGGLVPMVHFVGTAPHDGPGARAGELVLACCTMKPERVGGPPAAEAAEAVAVAMPAVLAAFNASLCAVSVYGCSALADDLPPGARAGVESGHAWLHANPDDFGPGADHFICVALDVRGSTRTLVARSKVIPKAANTPAQVMEPELHWSTTGDDVGEWSNLLALAQVVEQLQHDEPAEA